MCYLGGELDQAWRIGIAQKDLTAVAGRAGLMVQNLVLGSVLGGASLLAVLPRRCLAFEDTSDGVKCRDRRQKASDVSWAGWNQVSVRSARLLKKVKVDDAHVIHAVPRRGRNGVG